MLTIRGTRFAPARDDNVVSIGGDRALVLTASITELRVLAGEGTVTGPVKVTTAAGVSTSATDFKVLPWPAPDDVASPGAPAFFHGPQHGTPALGVADQQVLVVLAYPTDHDPGTPAQRTARRNAERVTFADARRFWVEATYGATSWGLHLYGLASAPKQPRFLLLATGGYRRSTPSPPAADETLRRHQRNDGLRGAPRLAFVASNVSNPASPSAGNAAALTGAGTGVAVAGTRAFVTAGTDGLYSSTSLRPRPQRLRTVPRPVGSTTSASMVPSAPSPHSQMVV